MERPPTRFARSGDAMIAYQVLGEGDLDLVLVGGPASHLDLQWEEPFSARGIERFASFARVLRFDRRGTGLSDPAQAAPTLEQQMDDMRAVLADAGFGRVAVFGAVEAGLSAMYVATYPDQVSALVLVNTPPSGGAVLTEDRRQQLLEIIENHWGEGDLLSLFAPSRASDPRFSEWWARFERGSVSPAMARRLVELNMQTDLRAVLPTVRVPTLVLHQTDNPLTPVELGRETAALIPGAKFLEFPGTDVYGWPGGDDPAMDEVEEFLTGRRRPREPERVLATVLFTDICGSTEKAAEVGDQAWRELLDRHNQLVRAELEKWRGREVKTLGDGFIATFDGPARGARCARAIVEGVEALGLEVRAGLHTGECELLDGDVTGIAVHIGARISAMAGGGEVLVSSTVKDLAVGSGLQFSDRGVHALQGVPGEWRAYALEG
jgi:class 3 adenylate cyclase/pimeloyl-ACP methyl ester carboxylesterase